MGEFIYDTKISLFEYLELKPFEKELLHTVLIQRKEPTPK
jgi:hypothetical protein